MPRVFSIRPTLQMKGRKFKGLRGWSGKPLHPPLTDIPVTCYVLVGTFDLISFLMRDSTGSVARDFYISGTHVLIAGAIVSVLTALTGFWDWLKSTPKHTQAWRTANFHMAVMLFVTALVIVDIVMRLSNWEDFHVKGPIMLLSVAIAGLVTLGATYGGALVYEYGFNVETAGDHPVWHESEEDVMPGEDKELGGEPDS
jgi:uncharacterized membrane protein